MTCFDRITTSSIPHKKLVAGWNSKFPAVYDRRSHVYQLTLIFDLEVCLEIKMEGLEQSQRGWGSHGGVVW
jgi:hypothetical protein